MSTVITRFRVKKAISTEPFQIIGWGHIVHSPVEELVPLGATLLVELHKPSNNLFFTFSNDYKITVEFETLGRLIVHGIIEQINT